MIEQRTVIKERVIHTNGAFTLKTYTEFSEDGVVLGQGKEHWRVINPGDGMADEPLEIVRLAAIEHTVEVIAAYRANREAEREE